MTTALIMGMVAIAAAMRQGGPVTIENVLWLTVITDLAIIGALIKFILS